MKSDSNTCSPVSNPLAHSLFLLWQFDCIDYLHNLEKLLNANTVNIKRLSGSRNYPWNFRETPKVFAHRSQTIITFSEFSQSDFNNIL